MVSSHSSKYNQCVRNLGEPSLVTKTDKFMGKPWTERNILKITYYVSIKPFEIGLKILNLGSYSSNHLVNEQAAPFDTSSCVTCNVFLKRIPIQASMPKISEAAAVSQ